MNELISQPILGVIQGLTELWPISSSAHLLLAPFFVGFRDFGLTTSVFLHFGTLLAITIYFRNDWLKFFLNDRKTFWLIIIATLPAALAGWLLNDLAETTFRNPIIVVINLIIFGLILLWADQIKGKQKKIGQLNLGQGLLIGLAQVIALIPGVSRSGITISAGLFLKLKKAQAARFSFLLLAPILLGAAVFKAWPIIVNPAAANLNWPATLLGLITSFLFSYLALIYLFRWLKKVGFWPFVIYRIVLAVIVLTVYFC